MLVGGAFEIVSGAAVGGFTCETGIGCLAAAGILTSGADNAGHGIVALWTGEQQTTFGAQLLMKTGLSQAQAEILYGLGAAGVELATMKYLVKSPGLLTDELLRSYRATPQVVQNRLNGAEFERQVIDALGGVKNTSSFTVTLPNGKQFTTIPDLWGRNAGGLLEAKNVINLSRSPQLRAQYELALQKNLPMNIVVSPRTKYISQPLIDDVRATGGDIFVYNPATDNLTKWALPL